MDKPLVSVLLPVYNSEKYVKEAIQSILNQSYKNFELIIINDGSIDSSEQVILSFNDSRIKYYKNSKNQKLIKTLNYGLALCNGKYIARMDSDDISLPKRLETQVEYLEENDSIGVVGANISLFGDNRKSNLTIRYPKSHEEILARAIFKAPFAHPCVMFRRNVIEQNNLKYNEKYLHSEDYVLWLELLQVTKGYNIEKVLLLYRESETQVSSLNRKIQTVNASQFACEFLTSNGLKMNLKQLELFSTTLFMQEVSDKKINYNELINLYEEIISFNSKSKIFPPKLFAENAARILFHKINAHKNFLAFINFRFSKLSHYYKGNILSIVKNKFF